MAKFKVGDKVKVHSPGYRAHGAEGRVMMVYLPGNPQKYLVDFGGGAHSEMTETSLVAANSVHPNVAALEKRLGRELTLDEVFEIGSKTRPGLTVDEMYKIVKAMKNSVASNTRTVPVSKLAVTECERKGIEVMKQYLKSHGGVLPKTAGEVTEVLKAVPDIDTTERQNVMSHFRYGPGRKFVTQNSRAPRSTDPVVANALAYAGRKACNAAIDDAVRAAVRTGKYNEAAFYKGGSLKKRVRV